MRQFRLITPTASISTLNPKNQSDSKKDKSSTCACSVQDNTKRKHQIISENPSPTIKKLIKMRSRTTNNSVSPEQAALVVKDYIMPLFKFERELKHKKRRSEIYASAKHKQIDSNESNVLSDFKLVNQLSSQLDKLKENNHEINKQLKDANQNKAAYGSEYKMIKDNLMAAETSIVFLNYMYTENIKKTNQEQFGKNIINEQLCKYKSLYEEEQRKCRSLSKMLGEERGNNDSLRNTAVQLESLNTLLVMENDIIGEKLKGLYISLTNLMGSNSAYSKLTEEFTMLSRSVYDLSLNISENNKTIGVIHEEKNELEKLVRELGDITLGIQGRKDKYIKNLRERVNKIESELKISNFERESQKSDLDELRKKFSDLKEEHLKLRNKIKKFKLSFAADFILEKYCQNCQKPFVDATNYN